MRATVAGKDSALKDDVVAKVAQRVQARPVGASSEPRHRLDVHRTRIEMWLRGDPPLRLVRVHELLARDGLSVSYTTPRRFVRAELGWRQRPVTVRVDDPPPADEAQIDFGEMGYVSDDESRRPTSRASPCPRRQRPSSGAASVCRPARVRHASP